MQQKCQQHIELPLERQRREEKQAFDSSEANGFEQHRHETQTEHDREQRKSEMLWKMKRRPSFTDKQMPILIIYEMFSQYNNRN